MVVRRVGSMPKRYVTAVQPQSHAWHLPVMAYNLKRPPTLFADRRIVAQTLEYCAFLTGNARFRVIVLDSFAGKMTTNAQFPHKLIQSYFGMRKLRRFAKISGGDTRCSKTVNSHFCCDTRSNNMPLYHGMSISLY